MGRSTLDIPSRCVRAILADDASACADLGIAHRSLLDDHGLSALIHPLYARTLRPDPELLASLRQSREDAYVHRDLAIAVLQDLAPKCACLGRVVLMQGLALHELVYPAQSARPISDIDLLVLDGGVSGIQAVLMEAGFEPMGAYDMVWRRAGLTIDLHDDLAASRRNPHRSKMDLPLEVQESTSVPGLYVLTLSTLAAHSVFHGLKHGLNRAVWELDIALLSRMGALDKMDPESFAGRCTSVAVDRLRQKGILDPAAIGTPGPARRGIRAAALLVLLGHGRREGVGELILSLLLPRLRDTVAYLLGAIIPSRRVLQEMYGRKPYALLLCRRVGVLAGYLMKAAVR